METGLFYFEYSGPQLPLAERQSISRAQITQSACLRDRTSEATGSVAPADRSISRTIAVPTTTPSA